MIHVVKWSHIPNLVLTWSTQCKESKGRLHLFLVGNILYEPSSGVAHLSCRGTTGRALPSQAVCMRGKPPRCWGHPMQLSAACWFWKPLPDLCSTDSTNGLRIFSWRQNARAIEINPLQPCITICCYVQRNHLQCSEPC